MHQVNCRFVAWCLRSLSITNYAEFFIIASFMERTELFVCKCFDVRHQLVLQVLETKENEEHIVYGSFHLVHIPFWYKLKCAIKYLFGIKRKDGDFDAMLFCPEDADRLEWFAKYLDAGLSVTDRDTNPIHFTFQSRDNVYDVAFETRQSTLCDGSEPTDSELSVCVSMKNGNMFYRIYRAAKYLFGYCSCYGDFDSFEFRQTDAFRLHRMASVLKS